LETLCATTTTTTTVGGWARFQRLGKAERKRVEEGGWAAVATTAHLREVGFSPLLLSGRVH